LNNLQLAFTTSLKATGVVENVTIVVCEDEFVVDVMLATLEAGMLRLTISSNE